ncbi:MAG TPA: DUF4881 domain-containing protein [Dissulfurispiraceae bacterium]|nr:DUF4881 domain-containing protein [Dissulfurispiraceae bacterium]
MRKMIFIIAWLIISAFLLTGCGQDFGKVDQGRTIAFDKENKTVTFIRDTNTDASKQPNYNGLPPVTYAIPSDPAEMGPEPKAGGRMKIDTKKNQIVIFDPKEQNFKTIDYKLVEQKENIERSDALVFDKAKEQAKKLPVVDREKKSITVYSARQKTYTVFNVPDEYFAYPDSTWDAGDEVRVYYKEAGKAARLMNVTKTDIYKK